MVGDGAADGRLGGVEVGGERGMLQPSSSRACRQPHTLAEPSRLACWSRWRSRPSATTEPPLRRSANPSAWVTLTGGHRRVEASRCVAVRPVATILKVGCGAIHSINGYVDQEATRDGGEGGTRRAEQAGRHARDPGNRVRRVIHIGVDDLHSTSTNSLPETQITSFRAAQPWSAPAGNIGCKRRVHSNLEVANFVRQHGLVPVVDEANA